MTARFPRTFAPRRPRLRRRGLAARLGMFALACLVLVASAVGGARFQWCAMMARPQLHCCCPQPSAHGAPREPRGTVAAESCCEVRHIAALPPASDASHAPPTVLPAPLAAVIPLALWLAGDAAGRDEHVLARSNLPRAGPEPPLYDLHRSYLN